MSGLRRKLQQYIALNNYVEATRQNTDSVTLTDAVSNGLVELKAHGKSEVKGKVFTSVVAKGKCEQSNLPTPSNPINVTCNNGIISISKNKANYIASNVTLGYWIRNSDGQPEASSANFYTNSYIPVKPDTSYVCYGRKKSDGILSNYNRIAWYDSSKTWIRNSTYTQGTIGIDTSPSNAAYARFHCNPTGDTVTQTIVDSFDWTFGEGTAEYPEFIPFGVTVNGTQETITSSRGGIVLCEKLLSIGTYQDTQEIISGTIIRNIGVLVLDGTEDWAYSAGWSDTTHKCFYVALDNIKQQTNLSNECLCSHFEWYSRDDLYADKTIMGGCISGYTSTNPESGKALTFRISSSIATSATDFKQWLADQHAAGTPVIVIYPLATATTETVASQSLRYGELTVEGSLSNLEVETATQTVTTPTPKDPLDIYCNNGVLKLKAIVPTGYTPLDKITNTASTRIRTSIIPNVDDMEFEIQVNHPTAGSWYILQARYDQYSSVYGISGSSTGNTFLGSWSGSNARTTNIVRNSTHNYYIKFTVKNGNSTLYIRDLTTGEEETVQGSYTYTSLSEPICIFANTAGNTVSSGNELVFAKVYKSGQLVLDCVPASDGNNNVGVYDRVSQALLVPEIGGVIAGNPIDNIKITVEGNPEILTIKGNNLYDITKDVNGKYIDANGNIGDEARACYCDLIPVKPGETYTYSGICKSSSGTSNNKRIHGYIDGIWNQQIKIVTANINTPFSDTFVIPANINGIRISHWYEDENTQVEESLRPTKYCEYLNSDLSVQDLFGIADYEDIQDILSGIITKNIGIKVFDGTETFITGNDGWISEDAITDQLRESYIPYCTHFNGTNTTPTANSNTVRVYHTSGGIPRVYFGLDKTIYTSAAVFKQWLADQYTAGTPVIVIYPLATPTTESVTKQSANITSNMNVVERNSKNISGLKVEATYKKLR